MADVSVTILLQSREFKGGRLSAASFPRNRRCCRATRAWRGSPGIRPVGPSPTDFDPSRMHRRKNRLACSGTGGRDPPDFMERDMNETIPAVRCGLATLIAFALAAPALVATAAATGDSSSTTDNKDLSEIVVTGAAQLRGDRHHGGDKTDIPLIETRNPSRSSPRTRIQLLQIQNLEQATRYTAGIIQRQLRRRRSLRLADAAGLHADRIPRWAAASDRGRRRSAVASRCLRASADRNPERTGVGALRPGAAGGYREYGEQASFGGCVGRGAIASRNLRPAPNGVDSTGPVESSDRVLYRLTALMRDTDAQVLYDHDRRALLAPAMTWNFADTAPSPS